MTKKGAITKTPFLRLKLILSIHIMWIALMVILVLWWGSIIFNQSAEITNLKIQLGLPAHEVISQLERTQRMIAWESVVFFLFLLVTTGFSIWIYWRDLKRTKSLSSFFAGVTHELKTPLTSIRLQAESVAEQAAALPEKTQTLIRRLLEDTLRLEHQVERTLELARIEGGGAVYCQNIRLKPWLERFIAQWNQQAQDKIEIIQNLSEITAYADPTALSIVLKNLIENSLKHSKKSPVKIHISAIQDLDKVFIEFKDDGNEMIENINHLGKIFVKGKNSQGTGVGLYMVKTLMKNMGGDALFDSKPGFYAKLGLNAGE